MIDFYVLPGPEGSPVRLWWPETDRWEKYGFWRAVIRIGWLRTCGFKGKYVP